MSTPALPGPIQAFVDATNAADTDAFLATFTPDAVLDDWGRVFSGREEIGQWNQTDNIGKQTRFEVISTATGPDPGSHVVTLRVGGNGHNGTGPITFRVRDDLISGVVISPT